MYSLLIFATILLTAVAIHDGVLGRLKMSELVWLIGAGVLLVLISGR